MMVGFGIGRRSADDDVETGRKLAGFGILDRLEVGANEFALDRVAHAAKDAVPRIARVTGDKDLAGQQFAAALPDLEMDVRRRPAGVGDGLDGAEAVFTGGGGNEPSVPLEIPIPPGVIGNAVAAVEVNAVGV